MAKMNWEKANRDQIVKERGGTWNWQEPTTPKKKKSKNKGTIMNSRFNGFCAKCHYTIWKNEKIRYNGKATHLDCKKAIKDSTPRVLDNKYLSTVGKVNKKKLRESL